MKQLLIILSAMLLGSCTEAVLNQNEYTVVDTLKNDKNGMGQTLGYDVIIRVNETNTFHYGHITTSGKLTQASILPLKPEQWKN